MAGTATEAGVSRQLVYDHFGDVGTLCEAFVTDRLARYRTGLPDISGLDADRATAAMFHHLVSIPGLAPRLARALGSMSPEVAAYKGLTSARAPLVSQIQACG